MFVQSVNLMQPQPEDFFVTYLVPEAKQLYKVQN